jgi:hypothetical protein
METLNRYIGEICITAAGFIDFPGRDCGAPPQPAQGCLCISFITEWISQTAKDES